MKTWRWMAVCAASLLLSGCAMGGATGAKTTQGIAALEAGAYQEAEELFSSALLEHEQKMLAYRGLGLAYMGMGEYEKAETALESALAETDDRMPGNRTDIRLYLASAQYELEKYEKTVDTCTEILEEESLAEAYYLRGAGELREGNQDDAGKDFDRAVALEPENYDLYLDIYESYHQMNLSGIGGEYLQSALNIRGEKQEDYYNRGRIYYYLESYEEAQSQLIGPVEQGYEPAMYLIGRVYLAQNDCEHAEAVYRQIQAQSGDSAAVFNGLAMCAIARGGYDEALACIQQGLALDGTEGKQELLFNEIIAYERKLDFASAREKAEAYTALYPADEAGKKELIFLSSR